MATWDKISGHSGKTQGASLWQHLVFAELSFLLLCPGFFHFIFRSSVRGSQSSLASSDSGTAQTHAQVRATRLPGIKHLREHFYPIFTDRKCRFIPFIYLRRECEGKLVFKVPCSYWLFFFIVMKSEHRAGSLAQITTLPVSVMSPTGPRARIWERVIRINQDPCLYLYIAFTCFPLSWNNSKGFTITSIAFPFFIPLSLEMSHHVRQGSQEVSAVNGKSSSQSKAAGQTCFLQPGREWKFPWGLCLWVPPVLPANLLPLIPRSPHNGLFNSSFCLWWVLPDYFSYLT